MSTENNGRRHFHRVRFDGRAFLTFESDEELPVELMDLSLQGALVRTLEPLAEDRRSTYAYLRVPLNADFHILLMIQVVRMDGRDLGLRVTQMDLESAQHLRRIVELNLGDPELLNRDLAALVNA